MLGVLWVGTEPENFYSDDCTVRTKHREVPSINVLLFYMSKLKTI